jgi:hypothetical protein
LASVGFVGLAVMGGGIRPSAATGTYTRQERGMAQRVVFHRSRMRPICPDFEPDCLRLVFCEARRCAVELRRGLTGELAHCPVSGNPAVATYQGPPRRSA